MKTTPIQLLVVGMTFGLLLAYLLLSQKEDGPASHFRNVNSPQPSKAMEKIQKSMKESPYLVISQNDFYLPLDVYGAQHEVATRTYLPLTYYHKFLWTNCLCNKEIYGNIVSDGYKIGCYDFVTRGKCSVYSLGCNNNIEFESRVYQEKKCEIHTYDMNTPTILLPEYIRFEQRMFGKCEECSSLPNILPSSGIDILKMDIEGAEWELMGELETVNAKMIQLEIHSMGIPQWEKLIRLSENWCLANIDLNVYCEYCLELLFVNRTLATKVYQK